MLQPRAAESSSSHIAASTGIIVVVVATVPVLWLLYALFGAMPTWLASTLVAMALVMTIVAQRNHDDVSTDPETGLPDRGAALERLSGLMDRTANPNRQAAVIVIRLEQVVNATDRRQITLTAALRLSEVLREGDQIIHLADNTLAAILGLSRGLDRDSIQGVMHRLEDVLSQSIRIDIAEFNPRITIGACGQCDAPAGDARSWLDAAEMAAEAAMNAGTPVLFVPGNPQIARRPRPFAARKQATDEDSFGLDGQTSPIHP